MKFHQTLGRLALALLALPLAAAAQQAALTAKSVNVRAGPDRAYPVVAVLPPSVEVLVYGCVSDYRWCDIGFGTERGWVYAGNLQYLYQQGYVPLLPLAPSLGIAVIPFGIDYWDLHYRMRPWYRDRDRWAHPPLPRPRPPRLPVPVPPQQRFYPVPPHAVQPHPGRPPGAHPPGGSPIHAPPGARPHPPAGGRDRAPGDHREPRGDGPGQSRGDGPGQPRGGPH